MEKGSIKVIKEIDKFSELIDIQRDAWGLIDIDIVPLHIFKAVADLLKPNGIVIGYFLEERIIGFIITFPTSNPKEVLAHMGAVSKEYQNTGVFYKLNLELREIMRSHGVDKIFGTYDPLESVNAHLYIRKLGGVITRHFINYYGDIDSIIHSGLPTDRFRVEWNIKDRSVEKGIRNRVKDYSRGINNTHEDKDTRYVEIPLNIQEIKNKDLDEAIEWRIRTRKLFDGIIEKQNLFGIDFIVDRINRKGIYVFKRMLKNNNLLV